MTKCKLKNGKEASLDSTKKVTNSIGNLIGDAKDVLLLNKLLGHLYKMANDSDYKILITAEAQELITRGFLQEDGSMTAENKNIIQSSFFVGPEWNIPFFQNPIEQELTGDHQDTA